VRVQAGRLRLKLNEYYLTEGREDPVLIELPTGSYVPRFRLRDPSEAGSQPRPSAESKGATLAVLKFEDHSAEHDQEYFCSGITEELINALTKVDSLRVVAWKSDLRPAGGSEGSGRLSQNWAADALLEGSVRKAGDRLRITAQLIRFSDGCYLWSETYDRMLHDIFAIQEEISQAIVGTLRLQLAGEPARVIVKRPTENLKAYKLYLKGRYFWNRRSEEGLKAAVQYFEKTVVEDPRYALAYAGLSDSYTLLGNYGVLPENEVRPKAKAAALMAQQIDDTLAEAHTSAGHVKATCDWDWPGAEVEYKHALALNMGYATAHHWYAVTCLTPTARLDEAAHHITEAVALDPTSVAIKRDAGVIYYYRREYDRAMRECQDTLELAPNFWGAYWVLGLVYEQQRRFDQAISAFQRGLDLSGWTPRMLGSLGHCYALQGNRRAAEKVLRELAVLSGRRHVSPFESACILVGMREYDAAFDCLTALLQLRCFDLIFLPVEPRFEEVCRDPRFQVLARQIAHADSAPRQALGRGSSPRPRRIRLDGPASVAST
jgi:serine/threonine-protein kinase